MSDSRASRDAAPETVAVIDVGSNSLRMVVAQVYSDGRIESLERMQRPVRLGHSTFVAARLNQQTMNAAVAVLRDYRRILDTYQVKHVRAVATSAVREADNSDAFVDRVAIATDLAVEVIEPSEESRLTVSAVRRAIGDAFGVNEERTLIVEIGGGSGLVTILEKGQIEAFESYNLGSIRLQEMLDTSQEPPERATDLLRHHIDNVVAGIRRTIPLSTVGSVVAIGGDARFAAGRVGEATSRPELHIIHAGAFDGLVKECARHSAEELARTYGLPFASAETLVPALLAYQALLHASRSTSMIVSNVSMRDGLLLDLARHVTGQEDPELARSVIQSVETVGEKYRYEGEHAHHVARLALRLFDELKSDHRLAPRYRLLLHVAALLHEIGGFVSSRTHHKHGYYLIANSTIFGLRREELEIVAHVARYHRRSCPKPSHLEYMSLPRERRVVVNKLGAILRIADALDRGHAQQVRDFAVERRPEEFVIYVHGVVDLALERRAILKKGDLFEDTYGMTVRLEEDSSASPDARRARPVE